MAYIYIYMAAYIYASTAYIDLRAPSMRLLFSDNRLAPSIGKIINFSGSFVVTMLGWPSAEVHIGAGTPCEY